MGGKEPLTDALRKPLFPLGKSGFFVPGPDSRRPVRHKPHAYFLLQALPDAPRVAPRPPQRVRVGGRQREPFKEAERIDVNAETFLSLNHAPLLGTGCAPTPAAPSEFKKLVYESKFTKCPLGMSFVNSPRARHRVPPIPLWNPLVEPAKSPS